MKEYKCPACGAKNTTVLRCETVTEIWKFDLETKESHVQDTTGGDFESYVCPECHEDLPREMNEQLDKSLFHLAE